MWQKILRRKKFIGVLITTVLLMAAGISYAVGVDGPEVRELSLSAALDLAVKNNPDMELADLTVRKAEINYDSAKRTAARMDVEEDILNGKSGNFPLTPAAQYQLGLTYWVQPKATEAAYILAQKKKELQANQLKLNVETTYYNVLKAQKNLAIKRENLKYFQDQLKIAQTGYKIGTRAKVDITVAESAVAAYQAQVAGADNNYRASLIDLNRLMALDLDTPLKLTTQLNLDKIGAKVDINATIKDALEDNVNILEYKKNLETAKVLAEVAKRFNGPGVPVYSTSDLDAKMAEVNVSKQSVLLTAAIKKSYLSLLTLEQSIDWQTKEVEKAKENAKVYALKYEAGLATGLDAKKATIDLEQAEENLSGSIYQYNTLKSSFKYGIFDTGSGNFNAGMAAAAQ
ncbi:MAG: TolC family protein [Thermincola sp.]|jgi:outer membrane protein TolC|nr:TolC family protein [Thermincola sp.]MDT3703429.1 TolC family protein [Thermincola sp.]